MPNADLLDIWNATTLLNWDAVKKSITLIVSIDEENNTANEKKVINHIIYTFCNIKWYISQVCVSSVSGKEDVEVDSSHQNSIITNLIVKWGDGDDHDDEKNICMAVETAVNNFLYKVIKLLNEKLLKNA